jgi:hypothetical protein
MDASLDVKRHGAVSDQLSAVSNQRTTKLQDAPWRVVPFVLQLNADS